MDLYRSVSSDILPLNGCLLHGAIFGLPVTANLTIVRHKMTEIVCDFQCSDFQQKSGGSEAMSRI